jgi:hypothetical protein
MYDLWITDRSEAKRQIDALDHIMREKIEPALRQWTKDRSDIDPLTGKPAFSFEAVNQPIYKARIRSSTSYTLEFEVRPDFVAVWVKVTQDNKETSEQVYHSVAVGPRSVAFFYTGDDEATDLTDILASFEDKALERTLYRVHD